MNISEKIKYPFKLMFEAFRLMFASEREIDLMSWNKVCEDNNKKEETKKSKALFYQEFVKENKLEINFELNKANIFGDYLLTIMSVSNNCDYYRVVFAKKEGEIHCFYISKTKLKALLKS